MKPEDLIRLAIELVNTDRQRDYDHPYDNFTRIAKIWSAILGVDVLPEQVALCMVGVKIAREAHAPKDDNVIDGYLIALKEFEEKKIPFIIKRPLPNGGCEYWKAADLEILV